MKYTRVEVDSQLLFPLMLMDTTICSLPTGDYYIVAFGYYNQCYFQKWYQDVYPWEDDPPQVYVDAPNETSNIDFTLEEGGSISGRIVDPTGVPLEGVEIGVYESTGGMGPTLIQIKRAIIV